MQFCGICDASGAVTIYISDCSVARNFLSRGEFSLYRYYQWSRRSGESVSEGRSALPDSRTKVHQLQLMREIGSVSQAVRLITRKIKNEFRFVCPHVDDEIAHLY